ncbi:MAG: hypothetical protein ACYC3W_11095 [Candidatus Nanopelagicales bacterium]
MYEDYEEIRDEPKKEVGMMNRIVAWAALLVVFSFIPVEGIAGDVTPRGRFQAFESESTKTTILVDTETGRTWKLIMLTETEQFKKFGAMGGWTELVRIDLPSGQNIRQSTPLSESKDK